MYYLTFVIKYFITVKAKFPTDLDYIVKIVPTFQSGLWRTDNSVMFSFTPLVTWLHMAAKTKHFH